MLKRLEEWFGRRIVRFLRWLDTPHLDLSPDSIGSAFDSEPCNIGEDRHLVRVLDHLCVTKANCFGVSLDKDLSTLWECFQENLEGYTEEVVYVANEA